MATNGQSDSNVLAVSHRHAESAARVIEAIIEGFALPDAVAVGGLTLSQFHDAVSSVRDLGLRYARAQEMRADVLVAEALEAADSNDDPQRARNRIQIRQWIASKYNSKRYGERIDVNVQQSISITDALGEARARLIRPINDQHADVVDAVEVTRSDKQSDASVAAALPAPGHPDIFGGGPQ